MRVLIGCEFSAVVRDAFRARGHDAWSCDLLPSEGDPRWHLQCDIFTVLDQGWDLMIFHWPCTRLTNSGVRWLYGGKGSVRDEQRWELMEAGRAQLQKVTRLWNPSYCRREPDPASLRTGDHGRLLPDYSALDVRAWRNEGYLPVAAEFTTTASNGNRNRKKTTSALRITRPESLEK